MIRKTQPTDLESIYQIRQAVSENRLEHSFHEFLSLASPFVEKGHAWVWEEDGVVLGEAAYDPESAYIEVLYVDPNAEGKGIGRSLLDRCVSEIKKYGHSEVKLNTCSGTRAERIYKQNGWCNDGYDSNGTIVYKKSLY